MLSLNIYSRKLFRWFRRPQPWATGDGQLHHWQCTTSPCITSRAEFFGETLNHPGDSAPLQPRFGALWCLAFPQTNITFEKEEISDHWWDSGKYNRAADGHWENCVRSPGAYFDGTQASLSDVKSLSHVQCFLCLVSSIKVSIFHSAWLDTCWIYVCIWYIYVHVCMQCKAQRR